MENFLKRKRQKINYEELDEKHIILNILEIVASKKCNLACEHCMRGDAEDAEISRETFDAIFQKVTVIENLNLGGGEISLSPNIIRDLVDSLKENKVIVNYFAVATNGTVLTDEYLDELVRLKQHVENCREFKISAFKKLPQDSFHVVVSTDDFHLTQIIKRGYTLENLLENIKKYREVLSDECVVFKGYCDFDIIKEGRAKDLPRMNGISFHALKPLSQKFSISSSPKTSLINGFLSISSDGEVLPGCNFSFENEKVFSTGNIREKKLSEIFKNINLTPVPMSEFHKFNRMIMDGYAVDPKDYKRYYATKGRKKDHFLWNNSEPNRT